MNTAVAATETWIREFGIDVEEIDQWERVLRAEKIPASQAAAARGWLEKHSAGVHYDGDRLTPELLERQIRSYYAHARPDRRARSGLHRDQGTA
jgi:L-fucose isomerase